MSHSDSILVISSKAWSELESKPVRLKMYTRLIERRFVTNNTEQFEANIKQMVPFLICACCLDLARRMITDYCLINIRHCTFDRETMGRSIHGLLEDALSLHDAELSSEERSFMSTTPELYQSAIRIVRSLAMDESNPSFAPPLFFLSDQEFADRMSMCKNAAKRVLNELMCEGIIVLERRGLPHQPGQTGVSTTYRYQPPQNDSESDCPF